jgi:hypothetical protein
VLQILQRQSQETHDDHAADFLASIPGNHEQQKRHTREGQPVDFAVQSHHRRGPGGLQRPDDQDQYPKAGEAK